MEITTVCEKNIHVKDSCCEKNENEDSHAVSENFTPKRYAGLQNQGATCYLNTVLQILFMTKEFREAAERYPMNNSTINNHIAQLFEHLKSGERNTVTTEGITAELKINVHKQDDAAKCLQKILNVVDPEMSEIFQGIKVDTTTCINPPNYHKPLEQVKSFFILSISLESQTNINLQNCFNSYFKSISMRGEGQQIYCKDCKMMMDTDMSCSLEKVPSVLVLHLERFELDYDTMCCVKNYSSVQIPTQLCIEEQVVKDKTAINQKYDLYAIANHFGSLNGGHYYANIKSFENQKWYEFNDSDVNEIKCDLDKDMSREAYLILYKKSATDSAHPSQFNSNQAEHQADLTKTCANPNLKRPSLLKHSEEVLNKKPATDSAQPSCHSHEILHAQDMMEERKSFECENPEKDETNHDNNKDPVESQFNSNQAEHQADLTKTCGNPNQKRPSLLEHSDEVLYKKFATDSISSEAPSCHSLEILHAQDMIEERKSGECDNPEKDETNYDNNKDPVESQSLSEHMEFLDSYKKSISAASETDCNFQKILHNQNMMEEVCHECKNTEEDEMNTEKDEMNSDNKKDPLESQFNFNLEEQQADPIRSFAFHQYMDSSESSIIVVQHLEMSEHSNSILEPNASTHLMSGGEFKSVIVTMSDTKERGKTRTRNFVLMFLLICVLLFVFVLLCIQVGIK